ncbi:hypothetical protein BD414DRAFT_476255 [Trametes punicea]|nr:hypothetical protein BD414DRAFT_476255 [Trametes punicea]
MRLSSTCSSSAVLLPCRTLLSGVRAILVNICLLSDAYLHPGRPRQATSPVLPGQLFPGAHAERRPFLTRSPPGPARWHAARRRIAVRRSVQGYIVRGSSEVFNIFYLCGIGRAPAANVLSISAPIPRSRSYAGMILQAISARAPGELA